MNNLYSARYFLPFSGSQCSFISLYVGGYQWDQRTSIFHCRQSSMPASSELESLSISQSSYRHLTCPKCIKLLLPTCPFTVHGIFCHTIKSKILLCLTHLPILLINWIIQPCLQAEAVLSAPFLCLYCQHPAIDHSSGVFHYVVVFFFIT
jgi:hypothetical protein